MLDTTYRYTDLKELMKTNMFGLGPVHFFTVFISEEKPVSESHVKEIRLVPVQFHEIQPLAVAVSPTEEGSWLPLLPGVSTSLLH